MIRGKEQARTAEKKREEEHCICAIARSAASLNIELLAAAARREASASAE